MQTDNFFLVIEGLDGSGKTVISRRLAHHIRMAFPDKVYLTFEPHDPSCAGIFIRQVLMKKITEFSPRTLALAFAANRLDHCDRRINPFLSQGRNRTVICDRYYLSSLVYQSTSNLSIEEVMRYNCDARRPDLTIFLDASKTKCYERMKRRAEDKELFEKKLGETRERYQEAIAFLRERGERIVSVDANGEIDEVLERVLVILDQQGPEWLVIQPVLPHFLPKVFSLNESADWTIADLALGFSHYWTRGPISSEHELRETLLALAQEVYDLVLRMSFNELGWLFLDCIQLAGYQIGERKPWSDLDAFELEYALPLNLVQRGTVLFIGEAQRYDVILKKAVTLKEMSDFMLVFAPDALEPLNGHYERGSVSYSDGTASVSPHTELLGRGFIAQSVLSAAIDMCRAEHMHTISRFPHLNRVLVDFAEADLSVPRQGFLRSNALTKPWAEVL